MVFQDFRYVLYLFKLKIGIKAMELLLVFIKGREKIGGKIVFDLLKSYGFRLKYLDESEDDDIIHGFFRF